MTRQPLQCRSPLSLAIALIGSAMAQDITGSLGPYSRFQQTVQIVAPARPPTCASPGRPRPPVRIGS